MVLFIFNACTGVQLEKQESAFIVIKTPTVKYADMGFISNSASKIKVAIYGAGQPLMNLEINGMTVCLRLSVWRKKILMKRF